MSDIILIHTVEDREWAMKLVAVFERQGWTVRCSSYPRDISTRRVHSSTRPIPKDQTKKPAGGTVNVVLWSRAARNTQPLTKVLKHSLTIPVFVLLENVAIPLGLWLSPEFDLSRWDGRDSHAGLQKLLRDLRAFIARSSPTAAPPASLEEASLSEIRENARQGIKESGLSRPNDDVRFGGVFISYRRSEAAAYAGRLYDRLAARFGKERVFVDTENVGWGEDFVEAITSAAESCAVMIALISREWSRGAGGREEVDDYVRLEVATALGRKIRVIPILIQGASMPAPKELPEDLSPLVRRNALVLSDTRWERDVEDLMKSLEGLLKD